MLYLKLIHDSSEGLLQFVDLLVELLPNFVL